MTIKSPAVVGTGTGHPVTVCVEELHQQIDAKSLPALEIENLLRGRRGHNQDAVGASVLERERPRCHA
jgi:hypothetical protein